MQSDHDGVKVENWLPVFPEDVQADVALKVDIGVVDLRAEVSIKIIGDAGSQWK